MPIITWKTVKTEFYTRTLVRPNRYGNTEVACLHRVIYWNAKDTSGRKVEGFNTRKDAIAALRFSQNG